MINMIAIESKSVQLDTNFMDQDPQPGDDHLRHHFCTTGGVLHHGRDLLHGFLGALNAFRKMLKEDLLKTFKTCQGLV